MKLERLFEISPAWDKRSDDPEKNFGVHGAELRMVVKGPEGAVQFVVYTNWDLPHVEEERAERTVREIKEQGKIDDAVGATIDRARLLYNITRPLPVDVGYHSKKPMYEGHEPMGSRSYKVRELSEREEIAEGIVGIGSIFDSFETGTFTACKYLDGAPCYYDGSGLQAHDMFELLVREGSEAVWEALEERYHELFTSESAASAESEGRTMS